MEGLVKDTRIVMGDNTEKKIQLVAAGDLVLTPTGPRKVLTSQLVSNEAKCYEVEFSNGTKLAASGSHPVYCDNSWVGIQGLKVGTPVTCLVVTVTNTVKEAKKRLVEVVEAVKNLFAKAKDDAEDALAEGDAKLKGIQFVAVVSVRELKRPTAIYNLTLEEEHCYFANGMLTHN